MDFHSGFSGREQDILDLFTSTFSASESAEEGALIGKFVTDLMEQTPAKDLVVWSAYDAETLLGCIFFSRLTFEQDERTAFILSPVAVKTDHQKTGIGQKLIARGLNELRQAGVDYVFTYGDPNYYSKTGFGQITEAFAKAPLKLSHPHGWLGQSLSNSDEKSFVGESRSVSAVNNPALW